jgi:hypothetical protein
VIDRVTVSEAAKRLGVTEGALRQRIHRGTIEHDKDDDGRVYVYITPDDMASNTVNDSVSDALLDEMRDRIRFLEQELADRKDEARRKDSIIMSLTQRVPELEAVTEQRESTVPATDDNSKGTAPEEPAAAETGKSWWRRVFGT